ncbi:MAG TPA: haloalkane dehalogenase [Kofleriaceae bacterium]|nr:haloalkane dehalogenase [Kofleriaceae bacterium]
MAAPGVDVNILRTPDACFAASARLLPEPRTLEIPAGSAAPGQTLRMAYVDTGPSDAPAVLLLHGEPTWSFLYRTIIARLVDAGLRAVAPDLIGFGRSDKPAAITDYSYQAHLDWTWAFIGSLRPSLGGRGLHLVCQDWGGLLGLRLVAEHPEAFASVVAMNTSLPTGAGRAPKEFLDWRDYALTTPTLPIGAIVRRMSARPITDDIVAAYDAPFPDESYKAGARAFPALVPITPDDPAAIANRAAWDSLAQFERPFLTLFGDGDPMTRGNDRAFQKRIPGCRGQPHAVLANVAHFIQEDVGDEVGRRIAAFIGG